MFNRIFKKRKWPEISMEDVRKRSKILVIDDMDFAYLELFINDGYSIDKWNDVDDLPKLEKGYYDIILLDIQGIGKAQSAEQGLGILKHLRKTSPAQVIIAFSNADYSLKYQDFFRMADLTLSKSSDYVEFKRAVDRLLGERFSLGFYIERVAGIASPYISDMSRLKALTSSALLSGNNKKLLAYLNENIETKEAISMILQVVSIGLTIAGML
jgi:DNA-binding NarL/FixJ family response regulator